MAAELVPACVPHSDRLYALVQALGVAADVRLALEAFRRWFGEACVLLPRFRPATQAFAKWRG